jgi:ABC-type transporter Mla MlaB component
VTIVFCDVSDVVDAEAATIDLIARLALGAKRLGCELSLQGASDDLLALVFFCGLGEALRVELERHPEEREERGGVEEERELPDPSL